MKTKLALSGLVLSLSLASTASLANTIEESVLGKNFCYSNSSNTGIGFSKNGEVFYFAPNIGAPDPNIVFKVEYLRPEDQFLIVKYDKRNPSLGQTIGRAFYDKGQDLLSIDGKQLSPCK